MVNLVFFQKIDVIYQELDDYEKKQDLPTITDALVEKDIRDKTDIENKNEIDALNATFDALTDVEKADQNNKDQLKQDIIDVNDKWEDLVTKQLLPDNMIKATVAEIKKVSKGVVPKPKKVKIKKYKFSNDKKLPILYY